MNYNFYKKIDDFKFYAPSKIGHHKYDCIFMLDGELHRVSFGAQDYSQFFDRIGYYSYLNNLDEEKRKNFKTRFQKLRRQKYSPAWFADNFLW